MVRISSSKLVLNQNQNIPASKINKNIEIYKLDESAQKTTTNSEKVHEDGIYFSKLHVFVSKNQNIQELVR
jgi:hypothetical protein